MKSPKGLLFLSLILLTSITQAQEVKKFRAYNRLDIEYEVVFPKNYSESNSYELAVVFSELEKGTDGHAATMQTLREQKDLNNTIYFVPKVPLGKPHWISHPAHHALNDFMKSMRKEYGKAGQKFHFIGHLFGGRVAQTYSGMSSEYVASLTFSHSKHWEITKQEYFNDIFGRGFNIYVYDSRKSNELAINVSKTKFQEVETFGGALKFIDQNIRSL